MRFSAAAIGFAFVCLSGAAEARPYFGFDGRNYGELANVPDYSRRAQPVIRGAHDEKDAPRSCLTPAAHALLDRIEAAFGEVRVISTCRPGARIATTGRISRHASGNAVDFDAGSRKAAIVKWLIANHHTGGTMTYSDMSHIHVDIGPHFVALARDSGTGGGGVRYSSRYESYGRYENARGYYDRAYRADYVRGEGYAYSYSEGRRYGGGYATIYQ
jgi:hypothetical protein